MKRYVISNREKQLGSLHLTWVTASWTEDLWGQRLCRWGLSCEYGRRGLENYWSGERPSHSPRWVGGGGLSPPPSLVLFDPPHSTWSWHLGQIHMPLGIVFRGGSKQSRWYTREQVSHISNWPLFLQTLQKSSWISPYDIVRKGKERTKT